MTMAGSDLPTRLTPHPAPPRSPVGRNRLLKPLLFMLFILGAHTSTSLQLDVGPAVPFVLCAVSAILTVILFGRHIKLRFNHPLVYYLAFALVVSLIVFDRTFAVDYATGYLQLIYSVIISVAAYHLVVSFSPREISGLCLSAIGIIVGLSVLEQIGPLNGLFGWLFSLLHPESAENLAQIAVNRIRDVQISGAVRSTALALEPSHAGISLLALSYGFFWGKPHRAGTFLAWGLMILVGMWAIRSPIVLYALFVPPVLFAVSNRRGSNGLQLVIALVVLAVVGLALSETFISIFANRIGTISQGEGSFMMRYVVPFVFLSEFASSHLLFGVGIVGNLDILGNEISAFYSSYGIYYIESDLAGASLSNNVAVHFIYFGIAGGILALLLLSLTVRLNSTKLWSILLIQIFSLLMFSGGYNSARPWVLCAILYGLAKLFQAAERAGGRPTPGEVSQSPLRAFAPARFRR